MTCDIVITATIIVITADATAVVNNNIILCDVYFSDGRFIVNEKQKKKKKNAIYMYVYIYRRRRLHAQALNITRIRYKIVKTNG